MNWVLFSLRIVLCLFILNLVREVIQYIKHPSKSNLAMQNCITQKKASMIFYVISICLSLILLFINLIANSENLIYIWIFFLAMILFSFILGRAYGRYSIVFEEDYIKYIPYFGKEIKYYYANINYFSLDNNDGHVIIYSNNGLLDIHYLGFENDVSQICSILQRNGIDFCKNSNPDVIILDHQKFYKGVYIVCLFVAIIISATLCYLYKDDSAIHSLMYGSILFVGIYLYVCLDVLFSKVLITNNSIVSQHFLGFKKIILFNDIQIIRKTEINGAYKYTVISTNRKKIVIKTIYNNCYEFLELAKKYNWIIS